jgi:polyribonucleotide nucleotidyltransferase
MFKITKREMEWGGATLTLETGRVARQADGSVIATLGETAVMANVTFAKEAKEGQDFFPLTVHYQEKYYAAGKIPGGFFKREARPDGKGNADRAADRPADPAAVRAGLQARSAGDVHRAEPRSGQRSRHRGDDRRLGRADDLGRALHGADRGGRVGFVDGEYVLNPPSTTCTTCATIPNSGSTWSSRAPGRGDDGRIRGL